MYDVARVAGVSQTTVSFVINDAPGANIPQETRDRVWAAVKELNYRPNAMARSLSLQRSHTIGFISDEIATNPHAGQTIQGAQDAAWASNKLLLVINTGGDPVLEEAAVETLLERQVEGIIYATWYHRVVTPPPQLSQVPAVLVDCYIEDRSLPSVVPDEVQGGRTATEALLRKGHRRIGFTTNRDPGPDPATVGRLEGYKQALAAYGVAFDPDLVAAGSDGAREGYRCAMMLMQLPDPPTALFCFNDVRAMGAYAALRELGLRIPDDVSVVGFDNLKLISTNLFPSLSTLELPHLEMGKWGIDYLIEHGNADGPVSPIQIRVPCPYIERLSV
jgi:LacI family transcriptional regulator